MSPVLSCDSVSVDYGTVRAVESLDLTVAEGETVALLGPSGSGKSTIMYAIAGFVELSAGTIAVDGSEVARPGRSVPPERRRIGLVFQNYALWPHLSAVETVAYPLRRSGLDRHQARAQARRILETLGIAELAERRPAELSGGEQQRVGLARALVRSARVYLFDEPTAHLDAAVRGSVQEEIGRRRKETGAAAVYATHDSAEALAVADRVAILRRGRLVQMGTPREIYERPLDLWAARLTGPASLLTGAVLNRVGTRLEVAMASTPIVAETARERVGSEVTVLVRPEWVSLGGPLVGEVREVWYRGPHTDYRLETPAGVLVARLPGPPQVVQGETAGWTVVRGWVPEISGDV